jgi:tetratricopeptide (TPR) repeat protein
MRPSGIVFLAFGVAALSAAQEPAPAQPAPAQTPPAQQAPAPPPAAAEPPREQQPQNVPTPRRPLGQEDRPLILAGRVMLEDGLAPLEPVSVQLVCNNRVAAATFTAAKGRFGFQFAQSRGATAPSNPMPQGPIMTEQQIVFCSLQAVAPGFRSEPLNLGGRRGASNPDVGVIVLRRREGVEGSTVSVTSLHAPEGARKAFEKGLEASKKKKAGDAEKEFRKAVGIYPRFAAAWFELGQVQEGQKRPEEARASYKQSLAADEKFIKPYLPLALMAAGERDWREMADASERAIRLDPYSFPQAYFYNSVANYNLGNLDAAEKSAWEAHKLDVQHRFPRVNHLLGMILTDRRQYAAALQFLGEYLKFAGPQEADAVRARITELEKLAGAQPE